MLLKSHIASSEVSHQEEKPISSATAQPKVTNDFKDSFPMFAGMLSMYSNNVKKVGQPSQ